MKKTIDIIVPCYNEEACIEIFYNAITSLFRNEIDRYNYSLLFIDDGSKDGTINEIKRLVDRDKEHVKFVSFSRNFGKESALFVGFEKSTGDYVVPMDVDLQHPPRLLLEMIQAIEEGYDCAAAKRVKRKGKEPLFRKIGSNLFYGVMRRISGVDLVPGSTDYRLMTRTVKDAIVEIQERERFTKGVYSWVGFKTKWLEYEDVDRTIGTTKWNFKGLFNYGLNGFVAFTTTPLRAATWLGMFTVAIALIYAICTAVNALAHPEYTTGRATILVLMLLLGGVIITILGIIGEYLARIYMEVKRRPLYIIRESNVDMITENRKNEFINDCNTNI